MKVLGIGGSLRENSNSLYLLNVAIEELKQAGIETEIISLRNKKIEPCTGCYDCREAHVCTIAGDDFNEIFDKMMAAKGIILSSPVYVSSVTPPLMNVLCRSAFVAHWGGKMMMGKVGGPITVAQRAGQNTALSQLLLWFFFNGITVPGSIYWNIGVAGTGGAHDAEKDTIGIQTIKAFGKNMSEIMNKLFVK
jgi:multimeric flavodoxin WrbA